jgi:hypothetical protein
VNISKVLKSVKGNDAEFVQNWINSQKKTFIMNIDDLDYQFKYLMRLKWISVVFATVCIVGLVILFNHLNSTTDTSSVSGLIVLWLTLAVIFYGARVSYEIWSTCRKFRKEYSLFIKLYSAINDNNNYLESLACEVETAQRRRDPKANSLRNKLKDHHTVLYAFGRCQYADWSNYFPK